MRQADPALLEPVVRPGLNCWRIERATAASVIVDAADYYHLVREAMEAAQQQILLIGWDFDTRISLEPKPSGSGLSLGQFLLRLARRNPERAIAILKWSFGAYKQFLRPSTLVMLLRWQVTRAISFRFDSAHPVGCSHHQKIVVVDDVFAVCGGIDTSTARWDTPEHLDDDPHRRLPNGKPYAPWHDVTMLMHGPVAAALGDLGRDRWQVATGKALPPPPAGDALWPDDLTPMFSDVDVAIARTRAAYGSVAEVREVEALFLDMIGVAKHLIYIENQYLTSGKIAAAIAKRMAEPDPPVVVVVLPRSADGWLEQVAMDGARVALARAVGKVDTGNRFRIYVPVTAGGADIYVHAKLCIIDDRLLRVGSANLNNRSLGLDSECDVIIDTALPANAGCGAAITALRDRLLAEHLGATPEAVAQAVRETGSLVAAIDALNPDSGKRLELLDLQQPGAFEAFIAENELLDPERADGFFEPLGKRGIWRSWRKGAKWNVRARLRGWRDRRRERRALRRG